MRATYSRLAVSMVAGAVVLSACGGGRGSPTADPALPRIVVVSVDGLRPDAVTQLGAGLTPNLHRFLAEGASTSNARADFTETVTLPNHAGMLTGRLTAGIDGHSLTFNEDNGGVIHGLNPAVPYVASVFDVVHDRGGTTGFYVNKEKLGLLDRSWDGANGAPDLTGGDDGRDKIDTFVFDSDESRLVDRFIADMGANPYSFSMIHLSAPDRVGHTAGWMSDPYFGAVQAVDGWIGQLLSFVEGDPVLASTTTIIVTSDHGGIGTNHEVAASVENYSVPVYVLGPGIGPGDLYGLNTSTRLDPGSGRPGPAAAPPPIRNAGLANLALDLLGMPPVPGSVLNQAQDLDVRALRPSIELSVFNPDTAEWQILFADGRQVDLYFGRPGDLPLLGDWDCDGSDTPGVYRPATGRVYLTNGTVTDVAETAYFFGGPGDLPLAGDWDGDGCDTVAVYRDGEVFITNGVFTAPADFSFSYGIEGDVAFAGDFNGNGIDSVGVHRSGPEMVFLRYTLTSGPADLGFFYGGSSDLVIAGDWDGDGHDTVGVYRSAISRFYLTNENRTREAEIILDFGDPGGLPVAGTVTQ